MADTSSITLIGPEDHGRRMSLEEFARAEGRPGHLYELERGTIVVVDVPGLPHGQVVRNIKKALERYDDAHPGRIHYMAGGSDAAMQMYEMQSERHPDVAVYLSAPPTDDPQPWDQWTPGIAVEVVSASSEQRDYQLKPEEYLKAGVQLYWIIDPRNRSATILARRLDTWREQRVDESGKLTTHLLPGFELPLAQVFSLP